MGSQKSVGKPKGIENWELMPTLTSSYLIPLNRAPTQVSIRNGILKRFVFIRVVRRTYLLWSNPRHHKKKGHREIRDRLLAGLDFAKDI